MAFICDEERRGETRERKGHSEREKENGGIALFVLYKD
jgi:hypothetical protein